MIQMWKDSLTNSMGASSTYANLATLSAKLYLLDMVTLSHPHTHICMNECVFTPNTLPSDICGCNKTIDRVAQSRSRYDDLSH